MSNTAGYSSKKTTLDIPKILETLTGSSYTMTPEEKELVGKILDRFNRMRNARSIIDRNWQTYIQQYEAQFVPYADGRSRSNVPLEWAVIELFVSEANNRDATEKIKGTSESDVKKAEVVRRVVDYCKTQYGLKAELYKNEYLTAIIGTGFYMTAYMQEARIINDTAFLDDGTPQYTKKMMYKNSIVIKALDPRSVFLDDRTNDFKDDNDQVYVEYITAPALESLKYNKSYKNVDSVQYGTRMEQVFWTTEERGKLNTELIELIHYFNKESDRYIVIANRSCIIRDTPLPYAHKELPIVPRQYGFNPLSKYGRGLCEALTQFKSNINNLQEMIMDGIYRSNNSTFVMANGLKLDGEKLGFNNSVVEANGPIGPENFQEIRGQAPNSAIFDFYQDLIRQVAIYIGIDPAGIVGQPDSTAFEAGLRQDTALKRVNVTLLNRDMALTEVYRRHLANILQFFPLSLARGILDLDNTKTTYPSIILK